jgi:amphi-Trp domain-containing protein
MEQTLVEMEQDMSRDDAAERIQEIVDKLRDGDTISLKSGENSITLDVPDQVELEIEVEEEDDEMSLEIELEWGKDASDGLLSVE